LLDSTTIASKMAQLRGLFVLSLSLLLSACGANQVVVQSQFPKPVLDPLPVKVGVFLSEEFKTHTFVDDPAERTERSWVVETGAAQVTLWQSILTHLFEQVVYLDALPENLDEEEDVGSTESSAELPRIDAILIPTIADLQYAIPAQTNSKVYEIWLKYDVTLNNPDMSPISEWSMTAYGKTPEAFMLGAQEAVEAAAVVALRDAGANFAVNFPKVPAVQTWLQKNRIDAEPVSSGGKP